MSVSHAMTDPGRGRTEQKLRFARLHLDELPAMPLPGRGHDFERAHQEAVLAQLMGAYHAFLQELNVVLGCGRRDDDVSLGKLHETLRERGRSSAVLRRLYELQQNEGSWLRQLQALRDSATHISGIPLVFYAGGEDDGKVALKHPRTMVEFPDSAVDTLTTWLENMRGLFDELRPLATAEREG
jgi:hypothetical protein